MNLPSRIASLLAFGAILALLPTGEALASVTGSFERSIALDGPIVLDVTTGSGEIVVRAGGSGKAEVIGHIRVGNRGLFGLTRRSDETMQEIVSRIESDPPVEYSDGRLRVGYFHDRTLSQNVSIDYEIVVPANTEVISDTGSGAQSISGVAGPVHADAGSGSINLQDIGGPVNADTGSGAIRAERISGSFEADAGSGSIYLSQSAPGDVVVSTGSGAIELHDVVGAVHASAGSGRIFVGGRQQGRWNLDAGSGSIRVDLPDDAAFDLDAESSSGGIVVDHPVTVQGSVSKKHLRGPVRGGGELLRIETNSGSIRVE